MMNRMMKKMAVVLTVATMSVAGSTTAFAANKPIDQYEVQVNKRYTLDDERNIEVTKVYEKDGRVFGTNRTIQWIDLDTGKTGESTLGFWGNTTVYPYGTKFPIIYLDA